MYTRIVLLYMCFFNFSAYSKDPCENHMTCDSCISAPYSCVWCKEEYWNDFRCKSSFDDNLCLDYRINPTSSIYLTDDRPVNDSLGNSVPIKPQKYKLNLRIEQEIKFKFMYNIINNYPVDIYFLFDTSKSMENVKYSTAKESEKIFRAMSNLTNDVRIGFGTFVDKNAIPYTLTNNSEATYSFRHHLSLTRNYDDFNKKLSLTPPGYNHDEPEGIFDALAQAISCKKTIEWRDQSRKIIVLLTDAPYHAANDGLLMGIRKPYDGKCYEKDGIYANEVIMDYPSVGIINKMARSKKITTVFIIKDEGNIKVLPYYKKLSNYLRDSWTVEYADNKVAEILTDIYNNITHTVKLDKQSEYRKKIDVKFEPDCDKTGHVNPNCIARSGTPIEFVGTIKLLPDINVNNFTVDIMVRGVKDKLTLDIQVINKCKCDVELKSAKCNTFGTRRCGICECDVDRYGEKCECTATSSMSFSNKSSCIAPNTNVFCSGHGFCLCGSCQCNERYNGRFCECDEDSCPRDSSGNICNGHGKCVCGSCICSSVDWTGKTCDCYKPETPCNKDGKLCNNRGKCKCGACKCDPIATWDARYYQDQHCRVQNNPDIVSRQCALLLDCAQCHRYEDSHCSKCNSDLRVTVTKTLEDANATDEPWSVCNFQSDGFSCYSRFAYKYDDESYTVQLIVQTDDDCAETYYLFGGIFLVSLILIGLATLVTWKLLTDLRDRREYQRFLKLCDEPTAEAHENPGYKAPSSTFTNPIFRTKSRRNKSKH